MGLYKPSHISPNFEEVIFDDIQKYNITNPGDSSPHYACYQKWVNSGKVIFGNGLKITFQINTDNSKVRAYKLDFLDSYIDYEDDNDSFIGTIYNNFDSPYSNQDIAEIIITMNDLINNDIFLQAGKNYKWRIRLYEDVLPLYEIKNTDYINSMSDDKIETLNVAGINNLSVDQAYNKFGIICTKKIGDINNFLILNNIKPGSMMISHSSENIVLTPAPNYTDSKNYKIEIKKGDSNTISINTQKNLLYSIDKNSETYLAYSSGEMPIKGQTLIGSGSLSGTTRDVVWIEKLNSDIYQDRFLELKFYSDYAFSPTPNSLGASKSNTNNSDFVPFNNILNLDACYSSDLKIGTDKYCGSSKTNFVIGWDGWKIVQDIIKQYESSESKNFLSFRDYVKQKKDYNSYIEKWYVSKDLINKDFIKYFTDGNMWVKINFFENTENTNIYLSDFIDKRHNFSEVSRYNEYKKIVTAGFDNRGFYLGINANEGLLGCFVDNNIGKDLFYNEADNMNIKNIQRDCPMGSYYVGDNVGWRKASDSIMLENDNQKGKTPYITLMYKQREQINSVDKSVGRYNLSKIILNKEMNFNKFQFGDRDNLENFQSVCCTNMVSDRFTESNIFINPGDNSIKAGESYIYTYYFDYNKKQSSSVFFEEDLQDFAVKISTYDQKTGKVVLENNQGFVMNTSWKYQIFNIKEKCYKEGELVNKYALSTTDADRDVFLGEPITKTYENIMNNYSPMDSGKGTDSIYNNSIKLFINPNIYIKEDLFKPTLIELYNDSGKIQLLLSLQQQFYKEKYAENYNYYKNFLIDKLDNEQWLLTLDYNISAYYNLIQSPNNYSGNTNINRSLDKLGIISSYALDQFTRPGTKFKIYSNFIDSDEEGYMYTRPIKQLDMYISEENDSSQIKLDPDSSKTFSAASTFKLKANIGDFDQEDRLTQNLSKIKYYKYVIRNNDKDILYEDQKIIYETKEIYDQNYSYVFKGILNGDYYAEFLFEDELGKIFKSHFRFKLDSSDFSEKFDPIIDACNQRVEIDVIKDMVQNLQLNNSIKIDLEIYKQFYNEENKSKIIMEVKDLAPSSLLSSIYDYNVGSNSIFRYLIKCKIKTSPVILKTYYSNFIKPIWRTWSVSSLEYDFKNHIYVLKDQFLFNGNLEYGNFDCNLMIDKYESYGKYNRISFNQQKYRSGEFSAILGNIVNCEYSEPIQKYNSWKKFISDKRAKLIKDPKGNVLLIAVSESPIYTVDFKSSKHPTTIKFNWQEIKDINEVSILKWGYNKDQVLIDSESISDATIN